MEKERKNDPPEVIPTRVPSASPTHTYPPRPLLLTVIRHLQLMHVEWIVQALV